MSYPAVSFLPTSGFIGLQQINDTSATQRHPLGTIVQAVDSTYGVGEFIYLKGVASTAAGDVVAYDAKGATTVRAVHGGATSIGPAAVAMSACVAGSYGWYQIGGAGPVNTGANTVAANAPLYLTSTAGRMDDAIVAGDGVQGITSTAANSGGFTICQFERPNIPAVGAGLPLSVTNLTLTEAQPTAGAVAATYSGRDVSGWTKVTVGKALWVAAGTTQDIVLLTLPAKAKILAVVCDTTEKLAGLSSTIALKIGSSAGGGEVLASHDVKTAVVTKGLVDADLGTSQVRSAVIQGGYTPSWTATTDITVRLTSGSGNIGSGTVTNLTTGSTDFYFKIEQPV